MTSTTEEIIKAVREWQAAQQALDNWWDDEDADPEDAFPLREVLMETIDALRALRLPEEQPDWQGPHKMRRVTGAELERARKLRLEEQP